MSASRRVFDTTELLETILLQVNDPTTILLSQRVDRTFLTTIRGSAKLLRSLWLLPLTSIDASPLNAIISRARKPFSITIPRSLRYSTAHFTEHIVDIRIDLDTPLGPRGGSWEGMRVASYEKMRLRVFVQQDAFMLGRIDKEVSGEFTAAEVLEMVKKEAMRGGDGRFGDAWMWEDESWGKVLEWIG